MAAPDSPLADQVRDAARRSGRVRQVAPHPHAPRPPGGDRRGRAPEYQIDGSKIYRTTITTDNGTIVADLDPQLAPNTVNNFVGLARQGYYDGLTFHRVVPEFVIQGGCPEGTGTGGPGYKFRDEPVKGEYTLGAFAMANSGPEHQRLAVLHQHRRLPAQADARTTTCSATSIEGMDVAQNDRGRRRDADR